MKGDNNIRLQVEKALRSNVLLDATEITVAVEDGDVLLSGYVDKYPKKELARKIAKEVQGVKSAAENLDVILPEGEQYSDSDIESYIIQRFIKNFGNSYDDIKVSVTNGKVRLEGLLKWKYQRDLAEECIINIAGITAIKNNINIPERANAGIDEKDVFAAIYGDPSITTDIKIEIFGNRIVLKGKVLSVNQKNLVTRLVRNVPNVREIENFLLVERTS